MKEYPSIPRHFTEFQAHVFDKLDGSNIRVEYSRSKKWYKFGKRHGLVDESDPLLGQAISVFRNDWAEILLKKAKDEHWQQAVLFFEFLGDNSFAGNHEIESKRLYLIDAALNRKGLLGPREYLKTFGELNIASYIGHYNWTRGFVQRVWENDVPGVTFEGVVGKAGEKHKLIMRKAKTHQWAEKVRNKFSLSDAVKIIDS